MFKNTLHHDLSQQDTPVVALQLLYSTLQYHKMFCFKVLCIGQQDIPPSCNAAALQLNRTLYCTAVTLQCNQMFCFKSTLHHALSQKNTRCSYNCALLLKVLFKLKSRGHPPDHAADPSNTNTSHQEII